MKLCYLLLTLVDDNNVVSILRTSCYGLCIFKIVLLLLFLFTSKVAYL